MPNASLRPPPPLRIGLASSRTGHSRKTLATYIYIQYTLNARGLIICKSLSRDTAALHVYKTHDKISISIGGINTARRRVLAKHTMYAEQGLSPKRKKTKSIVSSPSPLFYAKSRLKLTQRYALTASSNGTQVVLYLKRVQETGRRDKLL